MSFLKDLVKASGNEYANIVVSNMDVYFTYKHLLNQPLIATKILKQERSSSALIFYWGINKNFTELELRNFNSTGILYGVIAGIDAWKDAGLQIEQNENPDWDSGTIFGTGTSGIEKFRESIYKIDNLVFK